MVCRHTTRLTREMIDRNLPVLKRGDHIGMPLKKRLFGTVLKHHAIVDSYKVRDDKMPELSVIEVGLEGGEKKVMKIEASKCDRKLEDITLIEYEKRKYDHTETYNRANKWVKDKGQQGANDSDSETHYRLLTRNCEHFAAACVNGPTQFSPGYMKSVSVQSAKLCWLVLDICIALSQCACFIVNFNDYITNSVWAELAICEAAFLVVFIVIVLSEYLLFKRRTFGVCKECLCARRIIFLVKAFLFAITEIGNGFLVQPLNGATEDVTWVLRVSISTVEAVSIMFVAPCLTKCLIFCLGSKRCTQCSKCCSQCLCNICNFEKGSYKYVVHHIVCHDINVCVRHCCLYFGRCICEPNEQTVDEESDIIYI